MSGRVCRSRLCARRLRIDWREAIWLHENMDETGRRQLQNRGKFCSNRIGPLQQDQQGRDQDRDEPLETNHFSRYSGQYFFA